ncbi:hypothetical protein [Escherichia coli]|uniref:hypothetical protein n=1 Tax=Escherichia coli TaxID=562 RepID=UPI0013DDD479|nr:hypothetical protein [Escherichia coli]QIF16539.1 hypothetical protein G6Z99_27025 [Escherichia coli]
MILFSGSIYASVSIFVAPNWERETNSVKEIYEYLNDIKYDNSIVDSSYTDVIQRELGIYRDRLQKKLVDFNGRGVCKISITTGNTNVKDLLPPDVVIFNDFAENSLPDCQKLHKKLQEVVDGDSSFFYPERIKSEGLLSIDLIFVLNGGSDRVAANGDK